MKREEAKEALSALMDGELGKSRGMRVLDVVADDEELIRTWRAYHLARDVLRREADVALGGGIAILAVPALFLRVVSTDVFTRAPFRGVAPST